MQKTVIIIGAGPAGLMAAEGVRAAGHQVQVYDAQASACRKFLLAGIGGMNITHSEAYPEFIQRYYDKADWLGTAIRQFDAGALREWIHDLGIETFIGTSGRVFPKEMKAAPLLRYWLKRLRESGVEFYMRHKMVSLEKNQVEFDCNGEKVIAKADAIVLAMGGASWPKLGSDGAWQAILQNNGVMVEPLQSANCGFYSEWSEHLQTKFAGSPLKSVAFSFALGDGKIVSKQGECIVTKDGMEGSSIYAFSKYIRDDINACGHGVITIDLLPLQTEEQLIKKLQNIKPKESFSKYLKRTLGISGVKTALLYETYDKDQYQTPATLARCLKSLSVSFYKTKPIEEVISSAGGVCESAVNEKLMLNAMPSVFCAGEMLDWEAPTGGYLLTACFATGHLAGQGVNDWLASRLA
ncbi:TIGR03862 family flavoprotein [Marinomonas sp. 5E14-1]|uniref:TIGR03862 family flavoprotein n=1 Tax=Marinomonas sp. 5E14-1 TaxID=3153922 RepID=UPI00326588BA